MSAKLEHAVEALLAHSLHAWRVCANISREADGGLLIVAANKRVRIARAPPSLPFRWTVADAERTRGASSVTGVLRHVRAVLDPSHRSVRLRIEPLPPASS
jgi:hypothetical protein